MKGFFGYAVAMAMIIILLYFIPSIETNSHEFEKIKNELIITEEANKERTLLENNTDKIIYTKLNEQIEKENFKVAQAQNEINTALSKYLIKKTNASTILNQTLGETTKEFLNENSSVAIFQTNELTYAEYVFTSSPTKSTTVSAKSGNKIISYFQIPPGSKTKIIKVKE